MAVQPFNFQVTSAGSSTVIAGGGNNGETVWVFSAPVNFSAWYAAWLDDEDGVFPDSDKLVDFSVVEDGAWDVTRPGLLTGAATFYVIASTFGEDASLDSSSAMVPVEFNFVAGTEGPDEIVGTAGADILNGLGGDDQINGLAGHDLIAGGAGADVVIGGTGDDRLYGYYDPTNANTRAGDGSDGFNILDGGDGNDILVGGEFGNLILGGEGDDQISGGSGHDGPQGGSGFADPLGNVAFHYAGLTGLYGGAGNDVISGGAGDEISTARAATTR